jgi:putative nucleotidyltransferase with HDIG domain
MNDPRSTVNDLVETIKYDQAVTSEVLRLCNSAYFGLSRHVTSLQDAMKCLGTVKVLQMVMANHTNAMLSRPQRGYGLEPGILWKHSVAVALASALLSQRLEMSRVNLIFTAGLIHDLGKVILNEYVAKEFAEIGRMVAQEHVSFDEAEQRIFGFSHQEVGGMIAEQWKLPEAIVRCVRFHHAPWTVNPPDTLVDIVYLADCTCLLLGIGLGEDGLHYRADEAVMQRCGLDERDVETIAAQLVLDLCRVERMFADSRETPGAVRSA